LRSRSASFIAIEEQNDVAEPSARGRTDPPLLSRNDPGSL
jgi:hypothetical protein